METLLDTNFLIECAKNKIDFFSQLNEDFPNYKITIPQEVIEELKKIKERDGKSTDKKAAELAIEIIKKNKRKISSPELNQKDVDEGIIKYLEKKKTILGTNDKEMKKKIRDRKINSTFLRIIGKKKIEVT